MRCSVARRCERTVGRRCPPLWAGGGLLPHCVVVTALGAELASCASHTERRVVHPGAELRRYGKPQCLSWQGRERAEHFGGWQRCGAGELCEPHLPLSMTLQADHFRPLSNNHSRPVAATIKMTITLHGVDDVGSSLGVEAGFASGAFFDGGSWAIRGASVSWGLLTDGTATSTP